MAHYQAKRLLIGILGCGYSFVAVPVWAQGLPLSPEFSLICEAGSMLGGGAAEQQSSLTEFRKVLVQRVVVADFNRDGKVDQHELQTLPRVSRQQALEELDTNGDHELSMQELTAQQQDAAAELRDEPAPSPDSEFMPSTSAEPQAFRNVRRFGIGLSVETPLPKPAPFAQAARFGTSPNFARPPRKNNLASHPADLGWTTVTGSYDHYFISSGSCQ